MQIPVGLMSPTALRNQRTYGNENQGYWEGDRYIAPKYKQKPPPSLMSPDVAAAVQMIDDSAKQAQQTAAQIPSMWGDGPQGEGFGGGRDSVAPGQSPGMSEAGHVNAPDVNANVAGMMGQPTPNPAGLPSLPDFKENTTPAAQTTPTNQDLAVSEVDPQGPSGATGKGKSGMSDQQAANQAAAQAQAEAQGLGRAAIDKAVQEKGLIDALKDAMQATAPAVGFNTTPDAAEAAAAAAAESAAPAGVPGSEQNSPNAVGGAMGGNTGGGLGQNDPNAGTGTPGAEASSPDNLRAGGRTGDDGDGKLEKRKINAHEREFMINPEMTSLMDRKAPGLLDALDRMQKGLMDRPRKPSRGLMGR